MNRTKKKLQEIQERKENARKARNIKYLEMGNREKSQKLSHALEQNAQMKRDLDSVVRADCYWRPSYDSPLVMCLEVDQREIFRNEAVIGQSIKKLVQAVQTALQNRSKEGGKKF